MADHGAPIAYLALEEGTPVFTSDGERIGAVEHVLADEESDIFDGLVVDTRSGPGGFRFADATEIDALYERGVVLALDREAAAGLPEPSGNPAAMRADPDDTTPNTAGDKLRRAWDYLSGRYSMPPTGHEWVDAFAARLGAEPPTPEERDAILDFAGEAAHASERIAAPIACWIAARHGLSVEEAMRLAKEAG